MNYIVLDLEWNQSAKGKEYSISSMPFEIIQVGAVKLNDKFQVIGEFDRLVRPQVYKKLHSICSEVTEITEEMLLSGDHFVDVAEDFLSWCGNDYIFCTWGDCDLLELQRNMNHYGMDNTFPMPFFFYDVQKLYSIYFSKGKHRLSLQAAVQELNLEEKDKYHTAIFDARYTTRVMKCLEFSSVEKFYSIDTYRVPRNRKEEITVNFGDYSKYISKTFDTREKALNDREVCSCRCFLCGKPMARMIKWFAGSRKNYYALFLCEEHGFIKGRLRTNMTDDKKYFAIKILKCTDVAGVEKIQQKKQREREHRREKRLNKSK